jgi:hypothetical protein
MRPRSKRTLYREVLYRSRIEARWAVFYDTLGIKHKYEPMWAEVDSRRGYVNYKPDFEITVPHDNYTYYVEIKDDSPTQEAITKACGWARDLGDVIIFFDLKPPKSDTESAWLFEWSDLDDQVHRHTNMWWCECPKCGYLGIQEFGELPCKCYPETNSNAVREWEDVFGTAGSLDFTRTPRLLGAYSRARDYAL